VLATALSATHTFESPSERAAAVTLDLADTPYSLEETGQGVIDDATRLMGRAALLRHDGTLSEATLRDYFGDKRFEQIAESNALEGSTLSVGETQLAVLSGVTITGHDPAYSRDAIALANALERMTALAQVDAPTDVGQLRQIHSLILGDRAGAGVFRSEPVAIAGSAHRPPRSWSEVMAAMECWETWSKGNPSVPPLLRGIVLHTWLTHIHPYIDGNGRTARAVLNLELIRAGLPSVIIRRKDRKRYLDALAESDVGGDLGPIAELVIDRASDALRDLERAATRYQGYDQAAVRLRQRQDRQLAIWNDSVKLLFSLLEEAAEHCFGQVGTVETRWYDDHLLLDDFVSLCRGDPAGNAWLFRIGVQVPALGTTSYLAWTGFRSHEMQSRSGVGSGPSVFWSVPDPSGYKKWIRDDSQSPGGAELSLELPNVDRWIVRLSSDEVQRLTPSELVEQIVQGIEAALSS
jgi:Fic family protein